MLENKFQKLVILFGFSVELTEWMFALITEAQLARFLSLEPMPLNPVPFSLFELSWHLLNSSSYRLDLY